MSPAEILERFSKLSALVVGDICLDRWCTYDPATSEPSRETGIPRLGVVRTEVTPGAGGTVANNLAALGVGKIAVLGAIGDDGFGYELRGALGRRNIESLSVRSREIQTFTYTKLINGDTGVEDQPRVDFINTAPLETAIEREILDRVQQAVDQYDVILVSDQAETSQGGVVTPAVSDLIADLAANYRDKIFFADSRARIHLFRNVIVKPNQQEAMAACSGDFPALLRQTCAPLLVVTHGAKGVLLVTSKGETWVPTIPIAKPVDICGAGDSFSAGCAMSLAAGATPVEAAQFGNLVASVTIMKKGTGTASPEEVMAAYERAYARH